MGVSTDILKRILGETGSVKYKGLCDKSIKAAWDELPTPARIKLCKMKGKGFSFMKDDILI
ncbi:MAG: hypothetical protein AXA67_12615 [Methylothermaceae bacteria B42]|nr:MAG: hypothetical protein AXA67_12615 [Methylothermaceae bacteria B42]